MDSTAIVVLLAVLSLLLIWLIFSVRKTVKNAQKKKVEEQQRELEAQRIKNLGNVGLNIPTTVRYMIKDRIFTEGRHPDTGKILSFTGLREPGQRHYSSGDLVFVLVDLTNPSNYHIQWDRELPKIEKSPRKFPKRPGQIDVDALPVITNRIKVRDDLLPDINHLKYARLLDDDDDLLGKNKNRRSRLKKQKCFLCQGKGTINTRCPQCKGTGRERVVEYLLGKRHISKQNCSACFGIGKSFPTCPHCNGKGYTLSI